MVDDMLDVGWSRKQFDLSGKVAVVTGGTGILGKLFCAALADHGASLAIIDRDDEMLKTVAQDIHDTFGVKAKGYAFDITNTDQLGHLVERVESDLGPVDILHNNAASKGKSLDVFFDPVENFTPETWQEIMGVNLEAAFFVAREFGKHMAARGKGSIIQTSSIYGIVGPDQRIYEGSEYMGRSINTPAVYSASKAGIVGLTHHLATYWGAKGVRVNTLTPGGVSSGQNDVFDQKYSNRVPLNRMAQAKEITGALIFLASDASSYITGQNIIVDGGLTAW
jgi:NAD(P)-dependent dehydrogenase (short-subunit alcohol dehydrogenase family)